jgi:hypothetical protein
MILMYMNIIQIFENTKHSIQEPIIRRYIVYTIYIYIDIYIYM